MSPYSSPTLFVSYAHIGVENNIQTIFFKPTSSNQKSVPKLCASRWCKFDRVFLHLSRNVSTCVCGSGLHRPRHVSAREGNIQYINTEKIQRVGPSVKRHIDLLSAPSVKFWLPLGPASVKVLPSEGGCHASQGLLRGAWARYYCTPSALCFIVAWVPCWVLGSGRRYT